MLLRLAFANVWRRLSRSALTLIAMAMAAAVLTSGLSLAQGTARLAFSDYRAYYGGDLMVYSPGFVGANPVDSASETTINQRVLHDSGFNQLLRLYPDFGTKGYLAEEQWTYSAISPERIAAITQNTGVVDARPQLVMPVYINGLRYILRPLPEDWDSLVVAGDEGLLSVQDRLVVAVNAYSDGPAPPIVGSLIDLAIPQFAIDSFGVPYAEHGEPRSIYNAVVAGSLARPTRVISWAPDGGILQSEQGYVHSAEMYVPEDVWHQLWQKQSGGKPYPVTSLSIRVADMSQLNIIAGQLQSAYTDLAIFTVPGIVRHVERYGLLDRFYYAPIENWQPDTSGIRPYAPREFGLTTAFLLYLNAGMLLASQMLAAVASRRKEIGIIKAIGGRNREVVGMILLEAMFLSIIGSAIGFSLVRIASIHQAITNNIAIWSIIATTVKEIGVVVVFTTGISIVFGALPAWRVARLTVMEVFRNE